MAFEVSRIPFPDLGLRDGGYGSSIVPVGRLPRVVLSPPSGGVKVPLACVDLETGKVTTARGLLGVVRDGSIDEEAYELRVTSVCRREDGVWRVVHRHADPVPDSEPTHAHLGRLSDAQRDQ